MPTGIVLTGSYDYAVVAMSIGAAVAGSFAALELAGRFTAASGRARRRWLIVAACAQGIGIWSMHYTGMLAFRLPVPTRYDWPTALLSFAIALAGAIVAVFVVSRRQFRWRGVIAGSLFMATAIVGQHYVAMWSMRAPAECRYSPPLVLLSAVFAFGFSLLSLRVTFALRDALPDWEARRAPGAVLMGAAICVMHYTGMAAVTFTASNDPPVWTHAVAVSSLGAIALGAVTTALMGAAVVTSTMHQRTRARSDARAFSERLRAAREADARRIARELHDEVGSLLTAVKWELERLEPYCGTESGEAFNAMQRRLDETIDSVRRIASELRPPLLEDLGLEVAIEHEARLFERRTGIACRADVLLDPGHEPPLAEATALFRIVQEALTNVGRHAAATRVNILIEERDHGLALEIRDNGGGVPERALAAPSSLGLIGMRERAELIGGHLEIAAAPGGGTLITAAVPARRSPRRES
ncbi:MAG: domain S-box [Acidobacteria bacterium]|nr:domain S-box [Acidobacteriota bacterium]